MSAIAKVKHKQIDTGKIINILVQSENNAEEILFHIEGEPDLVSDFASLAFYLLYTRPGDTIPNIVLLENASVSDGVIKVPFVPTSYFTAEDGTVKIQLLISDIEVNLSVNDDGTIDGATLWSTFPAFLFVASSQLKATETIIEENVLTKYLSGIHAQALKTEGYAAGTQNGVAVTSGSEYYHNNGAYFAQQADYARQDAESAQGYAEDWADKMDGKILNVDYSSKYYAQTSREYAEGKKLDGTDVTSGETGYQNNAKYYANNAAASAAVVSAHATQIDAIADDLTKIDGVYAKLTEVEAVADDITNVNTVAGSISNVNTVAGDKTNIDAVAGNKTNINTVAGISSSVTTVAGISSAVSTVAGIDDEVGDVAGIKSDVTTVAGIASDVEAVADVDSDISTVAANISDVSAVATDIANVSAVAGDLTNIDAVAADLENIDDAVDYASLSRQYAEGKKLDGTDVVSGEAGYHNNAKYWADAVPALQAQVNANSARITNLEQTTKQDEQTVQYPDDGNYSSIMPNGVPASVAKYGEVAGIRGKSRGWNQLCPIDVLASKTVSDVTITNNGDGSYTLNGTASADIAEYLTSALNLPIGHKFLFGYVNINTEITGLLMRDQYSFAGTGTTTISNWSVSTSAFAVIIANGTALNNVKIIPIIHDLTLIFGAGNEPSTVADALAQLPALGQYNAYDAGSLVNTTVTGVEASVPYDGWDNLMENGYISRGTGQNVGDDSFYKRSANYVPVTPSTKYRMRYPSYGGVILYYGSDKTYLGSGDLADSSYEFVTGNNVYYIRFWFNYWKTYNNDIYVSDFDTLMLSSPVTLKSAGSVAEVLTLQTGKKTRPVGSYTFTGNDNWQSYSDGYILEINDLKIISADNPPNIICAGYATANIYSLSNMIIAQLNWDKYIFIRNSSFASVADCQTGMAGKTMNYELATPLSDEQVCDPIPDNYIEVEGGGTINTIQSQTPVIDNCLDVTYDFIPV